MGALSLFAHLTADTIVNGSATSHLAPTDHADREWMQQMLWVGFCSWGLFLVLFLVVDPPLGGCGTSLHSEGPATDLSSPQG